MSLFYLGALLLLGVLCARLFRRLGLPSITGYLLVGLGLGPSTLHAVGPETLSALRPLLTFALAVLFFLLGEEFRVKELRAIGARALAVTVIQALVTMALVTTTLLLCHTPLPVALLLGAIAETTDPAATVAVIREQRARGPLSRAMLSVIALNGFVGVTIFSLVLPLAQLAGAGQGSLAWLELLTGPAQMLGGAIALGLLLAVVLRAWSLSPLGRDALKLPTIALILVGSGLCELTGVSMLLAMLTFGAVVVNTVPAKRQVFEVAMAMEGPLLIMFFTLSGAGLHPAELTGLGGLGAVFVVGRVAGKWLGGFVGAHLVGDSPVCCRYLGFGLISQASMAIGLAFVVQERYPALAGAVLPVTLGAVLIFETIGPLLTRLALVRAGEVANARQTASTSASSSARLPVAEPT